MIKAEHGIDEIILRDFDFDRPHGLLPPQLTTLVAYLYLTLITIEARIVANKTGILMMRY